MHPGIGQLQRAAGQALLCAEEDAALVVVEPQSPKARVPALAQRAVAVEPHGPVAESGGPDSAVGRRRDVHCPARGQAGRAIERVDPAGCAQRRTRPPPIAYSATGVVANRRGPAPARRLTPRSSTRASLRKRRPSRVKKSPSPAATHSPSAVARRSLTIRNGAATERKLPPSRTQTPESKVPAQSEPRKTASASTWFPQIWPRGVIGLPSSQRPAPSVATSSLPFASSRPVSRAPCDRRAKDGGSGATSGAGRHTNLPPAARAHSERSVQTRRTPSCRMR